MRGTQRLSNQPKDTQLVHVGAETETLESLSLFRCPHAIGQHHPLVKPPAVSSGKAQRSQPHPSACYVGAPEPREAVRSAHGHTASSPESREDIPASQPRMPTSRKIISTSEGKHAGKSWPSPVHAHGQCDSVVLPHPFPLAGHEACRAGGAGTSSPARCFCRRDSSNCAFVLQRCRADTGRRGSSRQGWAWGWRSCPPRTASPQSRGAAAAPPPCRSAAAQPPSSQLRPALRNDNLGTRPSSMFWNLGPLHLASATPSCPQGVTGPRGF